MPRQGPQGPRGHRRGVASTAPVTRHQQLGSFAHIPGFYPCELTEHSLEVSKQSLLELWLPTQLNVLRFMLQSPKGPQAGFLVRAEDLRDRVSSPAATLRTLEFWQTLDISDERLPNHRGIQLNLGLVRATSAEKQSAGMTQVSFHLRAYLKL